MVSDSQKLQKGWASLHLLRTNMCFLSLCVSLSLSFSLFLSPCLFLSLSCSLSCSPSLSFSLSSIFLSFLFSFLPSLKYKLVSALSMHIQAKNQKFLETWKELVPNSCGGFWVATFYCKLFSFLKVQLFCFHNADEHVRIWMMHRYMDIFLASQYSEKLVLAMWRVETWKR